MSEGRKPKAVGRIIEVERRKDRLDIKVKLTTQGRKKLERLGIIRKEVEA